MATLLELSGYINNADLQNKVTSATIIAANNLLGVDATEQEKKFAANTFQNPQAMGKLVLMRVLAENKNFTTTQIDNATDTAIQNAVNGVIEYLIGV